MTERVVYHVTPSENVENILAIGLIPQIGERSMMVSERDPLIHLFLSTNALADAFETWMEDVFNEDAPLSLITISLPEDFPICDDPAFFGSVAICQHVIPSELIQSAVSLEMVSIDEIESGNAPVPASLRVTKPGR